MFSFCEQYYFIIFLLFFLDYTLLLDLHFLILAVIAQTFNPISELVIPLGVPTEEEKSEIEIHPVTVEANTRMCSISFRVIQIFLYLLGSAH